ncbi:DUF973 family protein [Acidianus sp. HS-5]|uniref:DUF973 family protein n=1 Tax=Acidianus sp. HS-5 TaxID=2886040 RepID=UPI001F3D292D|nr:DUF973 family protein [Acidianus sp. HS-5]BDC18019.1 hypothetical protein HS5_09090 [Acidianus sp. HS-5]
MEKSPESKLKTVAILLSLSTGVYYISYVLVFYFVYVIKYNFFVEMIFPGLLAVSLIALFPIGFLTRGLRNTNFNIGYLMYVAGIILFEFIPIPFLIFLGNFFLGIAYRDIGRLEKNRNLEKAGWVASVPFASFIGFSLCYVYYKSPEEVEKEEEMRREMEEIKPSPVPYQIGIGKLNSNGDFEFSFYSPREDKIIGVKFDDKIVNTEIPVKTGKNIVKGKVEIDPLKMVAGNLYNITVTFTNGETFTAVLQYSP